MSHQIFLDKIASLTPFVKKIVGEKATEPPYSGVCNPEGHPGSYLCRRCGLTLFRSINQFDSHCGWPSFDDNLPQAIQALPDQDGQRTEICCGRCDSHLGHVFRGEHFTEKNCRHCVNAAAIDFVTDLAVLDTEEAILAGGCFWGVEYFLSQCPGVVKVEVGYSGGMIESPSYETVCEGNTGHYEVVRVVFDRNKTDYRQIVQRFFEIHDPTQADGQGPDHGPQYQSALFYYTQSQYNDAQALMSTLKKNGYSVVTKLLPVQVFWPAEDYHQHYYITHRKMPYCHYPVARFEPLNH